MKNIISLLAIILFLTMTISPAMAYSGEGDKLVKSADSTAVYLVIDTSRYVFPDTKTYQSWYGDDFSTVETISDEELASYQIAGNVTHKPNSLIKIQSVPKVYKVLDNDGLISWIKTEEDAITEFGADWASLVSDVPAAFFVNYAIQEDQEPETPEEPEPPEEPKTTFEQTPAQPTKEDSNLIRITNNQLSDNNVDIIWSDTTYNLVWVQKDNLYYTYANNSNDIGPKSKINQTGIKCSNPEIAWDTNYLIIAWIGIEDDQTNVYFAKINTDGRVLTSKKIVENVDSDSTVSIAGDDGQFGITWDQIPEGSDQTNKEIFFANLDDVGKMKGEVLQVTDSDDLASTKPKVVWNNTEFGLFWQDRRAGTDNDEIYYTKIDLNNTKLLSDIRITNAEGISNSPNIYWDGTYYALIFYDSRNDGGYFFNLVYTNGTKKMPTAVRIDNNDEPFTGADITFRENFYYLAVTKKTDAPKIDDGTEIYLIKMSENGDIQTENRITYDPWDSINPTISANEDNVGMSWVDGRATCEDCIFNNETRNEIYYLKKE